MSHAITGANMSNITENSYKSQGNATCNICGQDDADCRCRECSDCGDWFEPQCPECVDGELRARIENIASEIVGTRPDEDQVKDWLDKLWGERDRTLSLIERLESRIERQESCIKGLVDEVSHLRRRERNKTVPPQTAPAKLASWKEAFPKPVRQAVA